MVRYIIRRSIGVVAILIVISIITFGIFAIIPANPALNACGKGCPIERQHEIEKKLGLNLPVFPVGCPAESVGLSSEQPATTNRRATPTATGTLPRMINRRAPK